MDNIYIVFILHIVDQLFDDILYTHYILIYSKHKGDDAPQNFHFHKLRTALECVQGLPTGHCPDPDQATFSSPNLILYYHLHRHLSNNLFFLGFRLHFIIQTHVY